MMQAAVVTISDTCYQKSQLDASGPAVSARLQEKGWTIAAAEILPDELTVIADRLRTIADSGEVGAIFTTGGTGIAKRDVTPEAVRMVIEKELPGFGEQMRAKGLQHTPLASLSRSLAGTRGGALIVALPGSPKGAVESLDAIVDLVPHVLRILAGETAHAATYRRP